MRRLVVAFLGALAIIVVPGAQLASADTVSMCGLLQALVKPNLPSQGGGVIEGPGSVNIDGKTFRLSSALPSISGANTIGVGAAVGKRVCLSGELVAGAGTPDLLNNYLLFASDVDVCGSLIRYQLAKPSTNAILSLNFAGASHDYQLVNTGTVPPNLGNLGTGLNPEIVRLIGRQVQGINTVTDYTVTRVPTCSGLPNTSTLATPPPSTFTLGLIELLLGGLAVLVVAGLHVAWNRRSFVTN